MAKKTAHKSEFHLGATKLGNVRTIKPSTKSRPVVDVTDMDSTIEEMIDEDIITMGTVEVAFFFQPGDTQAELIDDLFDAAAAADREETFKIIYKNFATDITDTFDGFITQIEVDELAPKSAVGRKITIQPTTNITRTVAAP